MVPPVLEVLLRRLANLRTQRPRRHTVSPATAITIAPALAACSPLRLAAPLKAPVVARRSAWWRRAH
eukprot:59758-Chlamydomonas_euryale.AAC.1